MFDTLKSQFGGYISVVCSHSFIWYIKFTYIVIKARFITNISLEGKDSVATWLPGFLLLSHLGCPSHGRSSHALMISSWKTFMQNMQCCSVTMYFLSQIKLFVWNVLTLSVRLLNNSLKIYPEQIKSRASRRYYDFIIIR